MLSAALAAAPDDLEHPAHDQLTALVDGRLDDADREWAEAHLEYCSVCREDVADLVDIRASLAAGPIAAPVARRTWLTPAIGFAAIAAGLALVVWMGNPLTTPEPTPVQEALAPAVPPVPVAAASPLTADEQSRVARALASRRLELPPNASLLRGRVGTLLGTTAAPPPLTPSSPVGTAVLDARPPFSWTAIADATGYSVAVFDERFRQVATSGLLTVPEWTPTRGLPRGRMLAWQITAHSPGGDVVSPAPPQPEARFIVLSSADVTAVAALRQRLDDEPLALGLALARTGLFAEAKVALERAVTDTRYDATTVRALIEQLK